MQFPVVAKTKQQLMRSTIPSNVAGGQAEVIPQVFFDTAVYTSATTTEISFFTQARGSRQLTNLNTPGQLPDPEYFEIFYFGLDVLLPPAADAWADLHNLLMGDTAANGGPTWQFTMSNKRYAGFPLTFLHESGGVRGFGFSTLSADAQEYARNAAPDGGWCVDGSIVIPPQQAFDLTITWPNAVTLTGGNPALRVWMAGNLHRKVL
jgi:hypothetical protein